MVVVVGGGGMQGVGEGSLHVPVLMTACLLKRIDISLYCIGIVVNYFKGNVWETSETRAERIWAFLNA